MKACKDCKQWRPAEEFGRTLRWKFAFGIIPYFERGDWTDLAVKYARCRISIWRYADIERKSEVPGSCGASAKHFEPREPSE